MDIMLVCCTGAVPGYFHGGGQEDADFRKIGGEGGYLLKNSSVLTHL